MVDRTGSFIFKQVSWKRRGWQENYKTSDSADTGEWVSRPACHQSHPRETPAARPAVCPEFPGCTVSRGDSQVMAVEMVLADCPGQSNLPLRRKGPTENPSEAAAPSHTGSYSDVPNWNRKKFRKLGDRNHFPLLETNQRQATGEASITLFINSSFMNYALLACLWLFPLLQLSWDFPHSVLFCVDTSVL